MLDAGVGAAAPGNTGAFSKIPPAAISVAVPAPVPAMAVSEPGTGVVGKLPFLVI